MTCVVFIMFREQTWHLNRSDHHHLCDSHWLFIYFIFLLYVYFQMIVEWKSNTACNGIGLFVLVCSHSLSHWASNPDYHMSAKQSLKIWGKGWVNQREWEQSVVSDLATNQCASSKKYGRSWIHFLSVLFWHVLIYYKIINSSQKDVRKV